MKQRNVKPSCVLLPLLLALSLTGCGTTRPVYVTSSPDLPSRPELTEPLPSQTYSDSARADIQTWRRAVTGTSPTSEH